MRLRATLALTTVMSALLVPFAPMAHALTTTATTIAYAADPDNDGYFDIYTMPADGSAGGTALAPNGKDRAAPALAPDGVRIAYAEDATDTGIDELRVRTIDGLGAVTSLTTGHDDYYPAWSRDGLTIAFARYDLVSGIPDVYTVPADGSAAPTLVATNATEPSFSPSGRQLVVDALTPDGANIGLDLVTLGSPITRAAVAGTGAGDDATFSPDGHWLVYRSPMMSPSMCRVALARVPVSGSTSPGTIVVGDTTTWYDNPEFSHDGTQVFATAYSNMCDSLNSMTDPATDVVAATWTDGPITTPLDAPAVRTTSTVNEQQSTVTGGTYATDTTAPAKPFVIATVAPTSAKLTWADSDTDASEFVLLQKAHGDPAPTSPTDGTVVYQGSAHTATITGLTPDTSYDTYVYAWDAAGNLSPVSDPRPFKTIAAPVLNNLPRVGVATLGTSFPVSWTGNALAYDVLVGERSHPSTTVWTSPVYHTWLGATAAKSGTFNGVQGHTYYFEVRGYDPYGNPTAYTGPKSASVPLNESSAAFAYSTGWTGVSGAANRYLGTYRYATAAGKYFSGRADTTSFTILGDKCAVCGQFKVYVDGVLKATVDTKAGTTYPRQVLWAGPTMLGGVKSHSIKVVVVGTAGRPRVDIDAIALSR